MRFVRGRSNEMTSGRKRIHWLFTFGTRQPDFRKQTMMAGGVLRKQDSFQIYVDILNGDATDVGAGDDVSGTKTETMRSDITTASDWSVISDSEPGAASGFSREHGKPIGGDSETVNGATLKLRSKSDETATNVLCGYLNKCKLGARGIGQLVFKRRWFVHADATCKLLYYRTPQDAIPLGDIDIGRATFTLEDQANPTSNVFKIR